MSQPFNQGPRLSEPSGDPSAQAIASLRGYAYQLYATGLAWLDLRAGQELYLEVAEDYAIATQEAHLRAVQVKDKTAKVTINSEDVRDALDNFVDLVERNPSRAVYLHFLSTCSIGQELKREHRANGEPTLVYWRRAAAGADIPPLRDVLASIALSDRVRSFIDARDDGALRDEFLHRIQWDCGQQSIEVLQRELENGLLRYYVERFRAAARRDQLAAAVVQRVLTTIVAGGQRRLTENDLLALVTDTANVLVPMSGFEIAGMSLAAIGGAQAQAPLESISPARLLEPERDLPLPPLLAERSEVTRDLFERTRQNGAAFVIGGTGCGKTTVARLTTRAENSPWCILDLRDNSSEEIAERLDYSLSSLGSSSYRGIILDDLNEIEEPRVQRGLARFLSALRRRDMLCLITAYRQPSRRALSELGLNENAHMKVPDLSLAEITAMVEAAGGESDKWWGAVQRGSAWGHPQCVQAIISGLRQRGWPEEERTGLLSFGPAADLDAERRAARGRIIAILSEETTKLLYRVSILFGRFDRPLALSVGAIDPAVPEPGAHLDRLIGPWVELTALRDMRVSPLLENAGTEILTPNETKRVHEAAAQYILGRGSVSIDKANFGFLHALLAEQDWLLMRLAYNIITASPETRRQLSEWMGNLRRHRLDRKINPNGRTAVSILLRLAQFLLIAPNATPNSIRNCWLGLQAELTEIEDTKLRQALEFMILASALFAHEAIAYLPNTVGLILRFASLSELDPEWRTKLDQRTQSADGRTHSVLGTIFITYALRIPSVADLQRAFDTLHHAAASQRAALLNDSLDMPGDVSHIVNHAWVEESKRQTPDWPAHLVAYGRMAEQAQSWGYRDLSIRCHIVRGIILDEYLNDPEGGLRALDDAEEILQSDPALDRARAKIFYRRKDHEAALQLFRQSAGKMELRDPAARAYMLREAAISAAELGEWAEAREWFAAACQAASNAASTFMKLMAIGLRADEALSAYLSGDIVAALNGLETALDDIAAVDPASSIAAGYRHRVIRHSILWLYGKTDDREVAVGDEPPIMEPGMCSNPEPTDLSSLQVASAEYARYLLAQAEIAAGVSAGMEERLRAHLGGRTIPMMEVLVCGTRMRSLARRLDAKGYVSALPYWVDSYIWVHANRDAHKNDLQNASFGVIPTATPEQLATELATFSAEDALLSFGMMAVFQRWSDALIALSEESGKIRTGYPGSSILEIMARGQAHVENLASYTAVQVHRVAQLDTLTPDELFIACVRFVQWAKHSALRSVLIPSLEAWARAAWERVIEEQRFNLRSPLSTVPAIRETLSSAEIGLGFLGKLIISALPAVNCSLDQTFRDSLLSS